MLRIDELHFSTLRGGLLDGWPAVCVELGDARSIGVPELLHSITGFAKNVVVKILGNAHDNGSEDLYALCSSLKEQGFIVAAELRGNEKRPWADSVQYKIAVISEDPWLMFACSEVRYSPSKGGAIPSPTLSGIHYSSYCYLIPHRDNTGEEVFDFFRSHPGFRVLSNKTYRKGITIKEE